MSICPALAAAASSCAALFVSSLQLLLGLARTKVAMAAEIELLRIQLAAYAGRDRAPRRLRLRDTDRLRLVLAARWCQWKQALLIVQPKTLLKWHRNLWRRFWRLKSRGGRPRVPPEVRHLIRQMRRDNGWSADQIARELRTKLGLRLSSRTVAKYLPKDAPGRPRGRGDQRWSTFCQEPRPDDARL